MFWLANTNVSLALLWHWQCHAGMWNEVRMIVKCNFLTKNFFSTDRYTRATRLFRIHVLKFQFEFQELTRMKSVAITAFTQIVGIWLFVHGWVAIQTPRAQSITYWIVENYCAFISVLGYIPLSSAYPRVPIKRTNNNTTVIICEPQTK